MFDDVVVRKKRANTAANASKILHGENFSLLSEVIFNTFMNLPCRRINFTWII